MPDIFKIENTPSRFIQKIWQCRTKRGEEIVVKTELEYMERAESDRRMCRWNIKKMLYIHLLGYDTPKLFLECLKSIESPCLLEKILGYHGLLVILGRIGDATVALTNSLRKNLLSSDIRVATVTLCAIGNIRSSCVFSELSNEIKSCLSVSNPYLRKKAIACYVQILRNFPEKGEQLFSDIYNGPVGEAAIPYLSFILEACRTSRKICAYCKEMIPMLQRMLEDALKQRESITFFDSICAVTALKILSKLGDEFVDLREKTKDIIFLVFVSIKATNSLGQMIIYEAAMIAIKLRLDDGLLCTSILVAEGFLKSRKGYVKWISLNMFGELSKVVPERIYPYQGRIIECLKNTDDHIVSSAIPICLSMINEGNIEHILGSIFDCCKKEIIYPHLVPLFSKVCKYTTGGSTTMALFIKILDYAKDDVVDELTYVFSLYISRQTETNREKITRKMLKLLEEMPHVSIGLLQCGCWCLGEYHATLDALGDVEKKICTVLQRIVSDPNIRDFTKNYAMTALIKISRSGGKVAAYTLGLFSEFPDLAIRSRVKEGLLLIENRYGPPDDCEEIDRDLWIVPIVASELMPMQRYCLYNRNGLLVEMCEYRDSVVQDLLTLKLVLQKLGPGWVQDIRVEVAKSPPAKIHVYIPSSTSIDCNLHAVQILKIKRNSMEPMTFSSRLSYYIGNSFFDDVLTFCV